MLLRRSQNWILILDYSFLDIVFYTIPQLTLFPRIGETGKSQLRDVALRILFFQIAHFDPLVLCQLVGHLVYRVAQAVAILDFRKRLH